MKHRIDPTVDCVFKALLGSEENKNLLIHFLNAVIDPPAGRRIAHVEILNPYNDREFLSDKLSIVDVKASDQAGTTYQIEVQVAIHGGLEARILYTWSDVYGSQLKSGEDYTKLKPVISIWVLTGILFKDSDAFHHHFQPWDRQNEVLLNEHCSIHVLELEKWDKDEVELELDRWTRFFRDGRELDDAHLPEFMNTLEMRQAMATLRQFSEKERAYDVYQCRMDYLREQATIRTLMENALRETEAARQETEASRLREEAATQREEAATQREEAALRETLAATQREEAALREKETARLGEEAALRENERLLRLLAEAGISLPTARPAGDVVKK